jgi:RHS repeat-associated protein
MYATTGTPLPLSTTNCTSTAATANILDFKYGFGLGATDNGNVYRITNNISSGRTQYFNYDGLNRIASAKTQAPTGPNCWGESYTYDIPNSSGAWGNLISISALSTHTSCTQESLNVTVTPQNQIVGDTYDAAGNLIAVPGTGGGSYAYNAENQMTSTAGVTYTYDGDGKRVQKSSGTLYWYGMSADPLVETNLQGNSATEYVFFGGKRIARRGPAGQLFYYVADHLGTSRMMVRAGQTSACYNADFYPFGGERVLTNTCPQNYKFTGKERDSESGLDNFGARYDSSSVGRFMTPDPLGGSLLDPQTLNKYSYVRNNPVTLTDPTGMYTCKDDDQCRTKQDRAFETARQENLKSKDPDVVRAAKAYGDPTKDNGVNVGFADLSSKGENGKTVSTIGTDANGNLRANSDVTINSKATGADLDAAVGHEGSHAADAQDVVRSGLTEDGQKIYAGENITPYASEQRAYGVTNSILSSENESRKFSCGMTDCTLGRGVMTGALPGVVDQILRSNAVYNVNGKSMSPTNQGPSAVNGVTPKASVPH